MPVSHSSFSKKIPTPVAVEKKQPESFVVDDASAELESKLQEFMAPPPVPEHQPLAEAQTKKDNKLLEDLIFVGKSSETVTIGNHTFEISTLSNKEHVEMLKFLVSVDPEPNVLIIRNVSLAAALRKIDGNPVSEFPIHEEFSSDLSKKLYIVEHLQFAIIEKLWSVYEELAEKTKQVVSGDLIKK